jgi:UDP-N-acetylglucosamine 1-carboxyvinyltransferase
MPEKFVIQGGKPLEGEVEIGGYKNAAGPILIASLLTDREIIIDNLPLVEDVFNTIEILKSLGVKVEWTGKRILKLKADNISPQNLDFAKVSKIRMSVVLIGALLSRFKSFRISRPGGDRIGLRPISTHLEALKKLGAEVSENGDFYEFEVKDLRGQEIILKEFSVTATENLIMAGVLAKGKTIIKGAAAEPQVQDLAEMLKKMGAKIEGIGTHTISIEGVKELGGVSHSIVSDPIEAGTFIVAGAVTPGRVIIKNIKLEHLDIFLDKLREIGVDFKKENNSVIINYSPNIKATKIQALPYPGFPTDLLPIVVPLLTQAEGKSLIHDPLYENRLNYTQELRKMGADIEIVDPHRAFIFGKTPLRGVRIESWDIRAGASLVIAGLLAQGQTTIENIYQIDRGYERIEEKLQKLGADIKRIH